MKTARVNLMFRAFSDRTRLRILRLLRDHQEICVGDLVEVLRVPQTTASRHLAYLRRSGLVTARKDGLWVHYSLTPATTSFHRSLLGCLSLCFEEVPELSADQERYKRLRRDAATCCPSLPTVRDRHSPVSRRRRSRSL